MCGVVCILLYCVLYQSSLWLPDFNKLLVLSEELNACWRIFGYSRFESVKQVVHGLGRLNIKHLLMLRKTKFYRHLHLSKNFLVNLFCVYLMHTADNCVKSVFLPEHVATETVTLSFLSYVYD